MFSQEMKGFGKKGLLRLQGKFLTFPREGKFTSSNFLPQKMFGVGRPTKRSRELLALPSRGGLRCKMSCSEGLTLFLEILIENMREDRNLLK